MSEGKCKRQIRLVIHGNHCCKLNCLTTFEWETSYKVLGVTFRQKSLRMLIVVEWASVLGKLLDAPCSKYTVHSWK
jgi:hypothetical protein